MKLVLTMSKTKAHILYVEDDQTLGFVTKDNLERVGFNVSHFADGKEALEAMRSMDFDLAILDIMLPEIDGFSLARALRLRNGHVPILFLSAKSMKEDKLKGFMSGGDDYITKPFSIEELIMRVNVFLRRSKVLGPDTRKAHEIGDYTLYYSDLMLRHRSGKEKLLTQKEADVLRFLVERENQICRRNLILEKIWGEDDYFMGRSLDVFISRLRKYLSDDEMVQIENIHGVGFKLRRED